MAIHFSESDINNIIKLYTVDMIGLKPIGKTFCVGEKPIKRILISRGVDISFRNATQFTEKQIKDIFHAYDSGVGVGGIPALLNLNCSPRPIGALIKSKYGIIRNRSEQQQARMDRASFYEKQALTNKANKAVRGSKVSVESKIKRSKTLEGSMDPQSTMEPIVYDFLIKNGFNPIPAKSIYIYNADFCLGNVAVEVFGGGWSVSDKGRLDRYVKRTKKLSDLGYHTVFILLTNNYKIGNGSELVRAINELSVLPAPAGQYRVIRGNTECSSGFSRDINNLSFVSPFEVIRDVATGRYNRAL